MQATTARAKARAIHDDTQAAMIRIAPSWRIGAHALTRTAPRYVPRAQRMHVRAYRAIKRAGAIAFDAIAWASIVGVAMPIGGAFIVAMVSPTGSAGQAFAAKVFTLYAQAMGIII